MVYQRVVSDLDWPVHYRWVMGHIWVKTLIGHMGLGQNILTHALSALMGQNPDGSHGFGSNYNDPLSALIKTSMGQRKLYFRRHRLYIHFILEKLCRV